MPRYRELLLDAPEAERMTFWTSSDDEAGTEDLAAWLASIGSEGTDGWTNGDGLALAWPRNLR